MADFFTNLLTPSQSPRQQLGGRAASGDDFGAQSARAVGSYGDALGKAGALIADAAASFKKDRDTLDEFNLQKSFADFQAAENEKMAAASRGVKDGAKDFAKGYMNGSGEEPKPGAQPEDTFTSRSSAWLDANVKNMPDTRRAEWGARMEQYRKSVAAFALRTELESRDSYYKSEVGKQLDRLSTQIDQQPESVDDFRARGEEIINASGMSEDDKRTHRDKWKNDAAYVYAVSKAHDSPEAVATAMGSVKAGYFARLRGKENAGGDPNARPRLPNGELASSATGFYQWTDGTWKAVVNSPDGKEAGLRLNGRGDLAQEEKAIRIFTEKNADTLKSAGIEPSEKNLYMAHFLGAAGATKFIGAMKKDSSQLAATVDPQAAVSNPTVFYVGGDPAKPRSVAEVYALQTQKFTGAAVAMQEDKRFSDMTYQQRMRVYDMAERQSQEQANAADARRTADHNAWLNDMALKAHDGKIGQSDIDAARANGRLTDFGDVSKLERIVAARQEGQDTLGKFSARINDPAATWNPFDKDHKDQVNEGVKALGNTPAAAFSVYEKTGIVPEVAGVAMRGGLASNDPAKVQEAANLAGNMLARNPNAFAGVQGGSSLEEAGVSFNHYVNDLGMTAQEAARKIADSNTPEFKRSAKVRDDDVKAFKQELAKGDPQGAVQNAFAGGLISRIWNGKPALGLGADQRGAIMQDFAELAAQHFAEGGDKDRAQAWATSQMKKLYGVSNGVLMKFPPERSYPDVDGKWDYIYRQAADEIKKANGADVDPSKVYLMPLPTLTAEATRNGRPAPYSVHYVETVDGQPMHKVLHGKGFVADPRPAQEKLAAERKAQFEKAQYDRMHPSAEDVALDAPPKWEPPTD